MTTSCSFVVHLWFIRIQNFMTSCSLVVYKDKDDKLWCIKIKKTSCSLVVYKNNDDKLFSCGL